MFKYALLGAIGALFADTAAAALGDDCTQAEYQGAASTEEVTAWGVGTVHYKLSGSGQGLGCKVEDPGTGPWTAVRFYKILGFKMYDVNNGFGAESLACGAEIAYCDGDGATTSCLTADGSPATGLGDDFYTAMSNGETPLQHCQPDTATEFAGYGGGSDGGSEAQADSFCATTGREDCLDTGSQSGPQSGPQSCPKTVVAKFISGDGADYTVEVDGASAETDPTITLCQGDTLSITRASGFDDHNLRIIGIDNGVDFTSNTGDIVPATAGDYTYECQVTSHTAEMAGIVRVLASSHADCQCAAPAPAPAPAPATCNEDPGLCVNGECAGGSCTCDAHWSGATCNTAIDYCETSVPTTIYVGEQDASNDGPLPHVEFYRDQDCLNKLTVLAGEAGDLSDRTYGISENTEYTFKTCNGPQNAWFGNHAIKVYSVSDTTDTAGHAGATAIVADNVVTITTGSNGALLRYEDEWVAGDTFGFFKSVPFEHGCENGAICTPEPTSYTCDCASGYESDYCETASACQVSSDSSKDGSDGFFHCINGGTATGTTGSCGCSCAAGYEGTNCQTASACQVSSNSSKDGSDGFFHCINGGTATGTTGSCGCDCANGWKGPNCQNDVDECNDAPGTNPNFPVECDTTGTASCNTAGGVNTRTCDCKGGYDGDRCQNDINDCLRVGGVSTGDPCLSEGGDCQPVCKHSALCTDLVEDYECDCDFSAGRGVEEGWNGTHCEISVNDCIEFPCTRGSCEDGHEEKGHLFRTCTCDGDGAGYFGDDCEKLIVEGCMDETKINYDDAATHDSSNDKCKAGHGGAIDFKSDRKERMGAWKSMQKRKYEKTDRADALLYTDPSKRMKIRKADRIEIKEEDFLAASWNKIKEIGFDDRPQKLEVGPENSGDSEVCQSKKQNGLALDIDDACITTMLDDEEVENGKKTLTKRALPDQQGSWQVVGKNISGVVTPIMKQIRTAPDADGDHAGKDKYIIQCWDEGTYGWEQFTVVREGEVFQCSKTRHRVLVGSLTEYPASCVLTGCTSQQKTEAYRNRNIGDDCDGETQDSDRGFTHREADTDDCKTLGCTTQQIVDSFTCS